MNYLHFRYPRPQVLFTQGFAVLAAVMIVALAAGSAAGQPKQNDADLWKRVEVVRTAHGVPHIRARDLRAAGYALAWLQCEDYGTSTPMRLLDARGRAASVLGYERIESDLAIGRVRAKGVSNYRLLSKDVRDVYEGFAAGVNRYIDLHREEFPANMPADFTGYDVAATEFPPAPARKIRSFIARVSPPAAGPERQQPPASEGDDQEGASPDDGSNTWAFAPSRTRSGRAILMRNPHLAWTAGYYEAHVTVPGELDFYGDFRIGGPFAVIGGFNRYLGWSTTNNSPDLDQFYSLDAAPNAPDRYMLDGASVPLTRELVTAQFRNGEGLSSETREFWSTQFGPVVHRANGKIYILKSAGDNEYRAGEQFLRMMRSKSLDEWKEAMKMRARVTSNFTYADRAGNIFYIWNASLPLLPHQPTHDLDAMPVRGAADVWAKYVPFESLPQVLNPKGGYIHQENSSPHYTNVREPVSTRNAFPNFEPPELSLRSQLALQLIGGDDKYSLEDVIRLKHSYRALLADRVKSDLIAAVKAASPSGDTAEALSLMERWDNTVSPESRGSTLFEIWWSHYSGIRPPERNILPDEKRYAKVWSEADAFNTPRGLADPGRAVESFTWAVGETKRRYGRIDVSWGEVHRVRRGKVDVPVGGCGNDLGCFRILTFNRDADGKLAAVGGDGWVLAVEFADTPVAYSVLAYGQSRRPDSPWHSDQAEMFAKGVLKRVAFTEEDVKSQAVLTYRPGERRAR
jgi:acyl-homoserine-lactone acylase